jgi:SOS-response transcriptional repressor LexA
MADLADAARAFLTRAVEVSGLKPHALAKKAGVAPTTITRPLNDPEFKFTPKPATLRKIAEAAGLDLPAGLAAGPVLPPTLQELPIVGPIQAGAWLALDETVQDEPIFFTAVADRRYPHARQWLREVRGDSMNAKGIMPGDLAHIVDLTEAGINLNTGMVVEVTRTRAGGALREITLKEVEISPDGVRLWPRSTNPRWADPLMLDDGSGADIEVQVTGLLLQAIKRFL